MYKLTALFRLRGDTKRDTYLICKEKMKYLFNRIFRQFIKISYFTMGEGLSEDVIAKNSYGIFKCRKQTYDLHIISDSYEFDVRTLFEDLLKESKVVVDVGANIGKYSILASKLNPDAQIFAIEPEKENNIILTENKNLNHVNNLEIMKLALSNKKGWVKLYLCGKNKGGHSMKGDRSSKFENVNGNTFDNIFFDKVNTIDLVKIDAEGNEFEILEGAKKFLSKKRIINIIVEVNNKETGDILKKYGYNLRRIQYNNYLAS